MNTTFPTVDFSTGLRRCQRQASLDRVAHSVMRLSGLAHDAVNLRCKAAALVAEINALLERDAELLFAPARRIAAYALMWIVPFAVCFVDYILLGSVLEYFALRVYSDPAMVTVTRAIIPPAIVTIEMFIAAQHAYAQEQAFESGRSRSYWIWHLLPLMMIIPLPTLVVATNIAAAPSARSSAFQTILILEIIGLVALSVTCHAVILYGGQLAADARGHLFSRLRVRQANRTLKRLRSRFESVITELANVYIRHLRLVEDHNHQFGTHLTEGPFDLVTQELLTEIFGDPDRTEVVEFPSRIDAA